MSLKRPTQYRYSWRKPWAYANYYDMRRAITEREVYRKLKILESHSAYKKPYLNYEDHPRGELNYSGPGWPAAGRYPGGGFDYPPEDPRSGECSMACNGGMLDCDRGGCDVATIICGIPPYTAVIVEDPTGSAHVIGQSLTTVEVCIDPQKTDEQYGVVIVEITDARGQKCTVEFPVVDCQDCCDAFTLSGSDTVNPGSTWTGTLSPCCQDIEVTATVDCGTVATSVSPDGCSVYVTPSEDACGTINVTVTHEDPLCTTRIATFGIKINNTGQGGEWEHDVSSTTLGLTGCNAGSCGGGGATYYTDYCYEDEYKYGGADINDPCEGTWNTQCKGNDAGDPCNPDGSQPPCMSKTPGSCSPYYCRAWSWWRCKWTCSC